MIEIIQQASKTEENLESRLPKNIRQIGNPEKDFRIYMEDYVYTYLHPAQIHGMETGIRPRLLILLGEINHFSDRSCAFISGAIQVENDGPPEEAPDFNEASWRRIHQEMQRFFQKCEIVGWVLDIPGNTLSVSREMEEMHRKNFVSKYQFFFLMDSKEREEAFYTWKDGCLSRKDGYFIYYEKNPQMQEYMVSQREELCGAAPETEDVSDQAAKNYRAMMMQKKEAREKERTGILSYLTSILTVIILCSVSVILLGSIRRMENMEQTISVMSDAVDAVTQENANVQGKITVETIKGTVFPLKGEGAKNQPPLDQPQEMAKEVPAETEALPEEIPSETESLPEEVPAETEALKEEDPPTEAEIYLAQGYYIVQEGDSLQKICRVIYQTDAMLKTLCELNQIEDQDTIYAGQKITLP